MERDGPAEDRDEPERADRGLARRLRAGVAVYNVGEYHAAHDAWEACWLDLEDGTDDERLLHGLIQYTAAVHHATNRNWAGAVGLAESGLGYLEGLPAEYRGVDLDRTREYLWLLASDPERIERAAPWPLVHGGEVVQPAALSDDELAIAAGAVAEHVGADEAVVEAAAERLDGEAAGQLRPLLVGFVERADARGTILQRLESHLDREQRKDADVGGLFEE